MEPWRKGNPHGAMEWGAWVLVAMGRSYTSKSLSVTALQSGGTTQVQTFSLHVQSVPLELTNSVSRPGLPVTLLKAVQDGKGTGGCVAVPSPL